MLSMNWDAFDGMRKEIRNAATMQLAGVISKDANQGTVDAMS